jgi:transcriptional antiterminator
MQEGFYSPQELSSRLSVSLKSVYNYINKDKKNIRFIKRGKQTFYSLEDILLLIKPYNVNLQNDLQNNLQNIQESTVNN